MEMRRTKEFMLFSILLLIWFGTLLVGHSLSQEERMVYNIFIYLLISLFQSPCDKMNRFVPSLKLNCEEITRKNSELFMENNIKKVEEAQRRKLLNFIETLKAK